jgi:hypothetical protein
MLQKTYLLDAVLLQVFLFLLSCEREREVSDKNTPTADDITQKP